MPFTDSSDSQKPPIPFLAQHEEEPGVSCLPGGEAEHGEVREEAAPRLLVTKAAWLRSRMLPSPVLRGDEERCEGRTAPAHAGSRPRAVPEPEGASGGRGTCLGWGSGATAVQTRMQRLLRGEPGQRAEFTGSRGHPRRAPKFHPRVLRRGVAGPPTCPRHHGQDGRSCGHRGFPPRGTLVPCCAPGMAAVPSVQGPQPSSSWGSPLGALGAAG